MEQSQIIRRLLLPPDQDRTETVHPTMRSFHHPPTGFEASLSLDRLCLFPSGTDVRRVAKLLRQLPHLVEVVSLVQAQALRLLGGRLRARHGDTLQRGPRHLEVVTVGSFHRQTDRNAVAFSAQAAFRAGLGPVGGIGTGFFPHPRALWSSPRPSTVRPNPGLSAPRIPVSRASTVS